MNNENLLPKSYEFKKTEEKWLARWLDSDLFYAKIDDSKKSFSIVMPPPNVTGVLHIGHALNNTLQDILVRYKRMEGYNVLWLPGTDHAGIATQNVVERQLLKEGLTRDDLGREKFIERVWKWKEESGGTIIQQLKRLGCSCDWSRERFTLDDGFSKAVKEAFVRLYHDGLIYRSNYIINWCPRCKTALSDIEVEHEPTEGKLYFIKYPLVDKSNYITVATTRPETMLGDTAVAVNPNDPRYASFIGKELILPLINRRIPVIADEEVDMDFGTGAVKITPAHDFHDFEIAKRHNLPAINIFDEHATINENGGPYKGLNRYEAREKIIEDLKNLQLLEKIEEHTIHLGGCYRCKTTVEPWVSKQWFVRTKELAKRALNAVIQGDTKLVPPSWFNTYEEWLTNIRDWCISRQIWWGHRIPAWYCNDCNETIVSVDEVIKCTKCNSTNITQDEDVLDTWFSSALWPFATLGWPEKTQDLKTFYPTSVLITSFDILFFWVARMMMMGLYFMNEVPFKYVYLHALVRDAKGQKMSKSKGNVIDPLVIMDKYGTDAVRFTLAALAAQGRDIKLSEEKIEGYKHFVNKIWNAARLILLNIPPDLKKTPPEPTTLFDKWIFTRLNTVINNVRAAFEKFDFDVVAREIYSFFWHEYCDWYLEIAKLGFNTNDPEQKNKNINNALFVLENVLKLLHPIMPFVTEELWSFLPGNNDFIMKEKYPEPLYMLDDQKSVELMEIFMKLITSTRNLKHDVGLHPATPVKLFILTHDEDVKILLNTYNEALKLLAKIETIEFIQDRENYAKNSASIILPNLEAYLPIKGLINVQDELVKLEKEKDKLLTELEKVNKKLTNEDFLKKAKEEAIIKEKEKHTEITSKLDRINARIELFKGM